MRARGVCVVSHVFRTAYAAVDTDAARLLATHAPDAVLMFGLAARTPFLRIETRARNRRASLLPDAAGINAADLLIRRGAPASLRGRAAFRHVLQAVRAAGVPVRLSRDAGDYLCNYLYWRMLETAPKATPVLFVHVPRIRTAPRRPRKGRGVTPAELARAAEAILLAFVAAARR